MNDRLHTTLLHLCCEPTPRSPTEIAGRAGITLDQLVAWSKTPRTRDDLAALRDVVDLRMQIFLSRHRILAVSNLHKVACASQGETARRACKDLLTMTLTPERKRPRKAAARASRRKPNLSRPQPATRPEAPAPAPAPGAPPYVRAAGIALLFLLLSFAAPRPRDLPLHARLGYPVPTMPGNSPRLTIINGRVIDPASGLDQQTDLVLENGKVVAIGRVSRPDGPTFDASGCIVSPGLIDVHVHFREPGQEEKETIATGAASAVNGGFTSVCCMPNTKPALDDDGRIGFVYEQAAKANLCNVFPVGAITKARKGEELAEIGLMARSGAVAFSDDGVAVASAGMMSRALRYIATTGRPLMQHCEEHTMTGGASMNAGTLATTLGLGGWPSVAEDLIIQRDVMLNQGVNCAYHVQHLTTGGGVEIVRRARAAGMLVTAEASPHHLLLTEQACASYDTNAKMNPPLRTAGDIDALLKGVKEGVITLLATDHAPHTAEEKELEFANAPFGIIGLDCALPLYIKALIDSGTIDYPAMLAMMTINGAELCRLEGKGTLDPRRGAHADVTIIDPRESWTINVDEFASRSRNCPFHGWNVTGRAIATIVAGDFKLNRDTARLKS